MSSGDGSRGLPRFERAALAADLTVGIVIGVLSVALTISLAVLAFASFSGDDLVDGIGLAMLSTLVLGFVIALASSLPGMLSHIQDAPAAILAATAAVVVSGFPPGTDPRDLFLTIAVGNALTTIFCGLVLLVLGAFRLGRLVRYLPYPVIGGFLAGTGWLLLGPFPEGDLLHVLDYRELGRVHWPSVAGYAATMAAVALISTMGVLFNATGLELATKRDVDLNQELRVAGFGNLLAGFAGGLVGYQLLGFTALNHRVGTGSRLAALVAVGTVAVAAWFGAPLLAFVPTMVVGALLVYLGLIFLQEWVYDAFFKLSRLEYGVVLLILLVIAAVGFLPGVGVGIVAALILFVVNYSRAEVVKHALTGRTFRSRLTRDEADAKALDARGEMLLILQLQGFIFFGTASGLLDRVEAHLARSPDIRYVLLDFRRVTGLDATALLGFEKLVQLAEQRGVTLAFSGLAPRLARQLERSGAAPSDRGVAVGFETMDDALEWCESKLLGARAPAEERPSFVAQLGRLLKEPGRASDLLPYFERLEIRSGQHLMREGDAPDVLYFIESGRVTARLEREGDAPMRLETMQGGSMVGEIGFYTGGVRTASVVADEDTTAYRLSAQALERMDREAPELAASFHELVVRLLAKRVRHLVGVVEALQR